MDVQSWLRKQLQAASPDLLRAMVRDFAEALMGAEADALCRAPYGEDSRERVHRNACGANNSTRERDVCKLHGAANRHFRTPEHASNRPREVQERKASEQDQERADAAPRPVVISPIRPILVDRRVVRRVATAQEPAEDQEHRKRDAGQS